MSRRKDDLRALLSGANAPEAPANDAEPANPAPTSRNHTSSGAVKAMGLALGSLTRDAEEARLLRESLAKGERVVELDPALIEPAFVSDRLSQGAENDETFEALKASISEGGQQVPVLVRPHPDAEKAKAGRYQTAYGHRRIAAAAALGLKVRALVRPLSDEELVIAQGKENSERRDLSFIERALFAKALLGRGFERGTVQSALNLHKAEMTRLLQVADAVPEHVARGIGPAPRAGRQRWMTLAEQLKGEAARIKANEEMRLERFKSATSDERFVMLLDRLTRRMRAGSKAAKPLKDEGGRVLAHFTASPKRSTLAFEQDEDFARFVAQELPSLRAAFDAKRGRGG